MKYYDKYNNDNFENINDDYDEIEYDDYRINLEEDNYDSIDSENCSDDENDDIADNIDDIENLDEELKKIDAEMKIPQKRDYDFTEIMEMYNSGDPIKRETAMLNAVDSLIGIVHLIIKQHYVTYRKKYYNDLISEGRVGIFKGLKTYDPAKSKPSTYFYPYIMHEIQSFIDSQVNKTTAHYSSNIRKINKVINELSLHNIPYDDVMIAEMTDLTMETVRQAMAIRSYRDEINYDKTTETFINDNTLNTYIQTPEDACVEKENAELIEYAMNTRLTEDERHIMEYSFGLNGFPVVSHKEISRKLGLPIDKVKKYYLSALRKLRDSELKNIHADHLKSEENFTLENDVPILPIQQALNGAKLLETVEIDF